MGNMGIGMIFGLNRRTMRRLVHRLRRADATAPDRACRLDGLSWLQARRLRRLLAVGAVREVSPGMFYLDEAGLAAWRRGRLRRVLAVLSGGLAAALAALHLGRKPG